MAWPSNTWTKCLHISYVWTQALNDHGCMKFPAHTTSLLNSPWAGTAVRHDLGDIFMGYKELGLFTLLSPCPDKSDASLLCAGHLSWVPTSAQGQVPPVWKTHSVWARSHTKQKEAGSPQGCQHCILLLWKPEGSHSSSTGPQSVHEKQEVTGRSPQFPAGQQVCYFLWGFPSQWLAPVHFVQLLLQGRFHHPWAEGKQNWSGCSFTHQCSTLGISPVQVLSSCKNVMNVTDHDLLWGSSHLIDPFLGDPC